MEIDEIQKKVYDINLVVEDIKEFPQTYNTILEGEYENKTLQFILRRKLNKLCKSGNIYKTAIPGTRFGKTIFFSIPKLYLILVEAGRTGSDVYVFFKFNKVSKYYIKVDECWYLKRGRWYKENEEKIFFEGNILKFI